MSAITCDHPAHDHSLHAIARRMAAALDHAVDGGMMHQADRLARNALRLAPYSSRLADRLARLRMMQGRADDALRILDDCSTPSASMRLLRNACLIQLGRHIEAQLDLQQWSRKSTAPLAARCLLAHLDARAGRMQDAADALVRNLQQVDDPTSLALLLVLTAQQDRPEQTQHWAQQLSSASLCANGLVDTDLLIESLNLRHASMQAQASSAQVASLAMELAAHPESISTLVEHQQRSLQPAVAELIYNALEQAIDELTDVYTGVEALAQLAILLGRTSQAAHWATRGLELNPMSASLRLLLQSIDQHDPTQPPSVGEHAETGRATSEHTTRRAA